MTFQIKIRGARGTMLADYECPAHGRFEALVQRGDDADPPSSQPCPALDDCAGCGGQPNAPGAPDCGVCQGSAWAVCGATSEYRMCAPLARVNPIEAVKGGWAKPARKTYTDTRNLGEGQSLTDWKEDRAAVWEEKRKQDVVAFARMHNERVRGD